MVKKNYIIPILALIIVAALIVYGSIAQDQNYHHFADERETFGIPNFLNVVTNLPFIILATVGLYAVAKLERKIKLIGGVLFVGFLLLTFGSGYYHLQPNNTTLVYDRIPIAIIIMSFFTLIIEHHLHPRRTSVWLAILNLIGIVSVLYWAISEDAGRGDLRWYAMVQFFPIFAVPVILWLYKSDFNYSKEILLIYISFILAKVTETYDKEIFLLLGKVISGHTFKHLLMAASGCGIILLIKRRDKSIHQITY